MRVVAMLGLALAVGGPASADESGTPVLPNDVSSLLSRLSACHHWAAQGSYDQHRNMINREMNDLGCRNLERDEKVVRERHADDQESLDALDRAHGRPS